MRRRISFQFHGSRMSAVLGALVAAGVLLCLVLLFLGLWIVFVVAIVVVTLVAIARALLTRRPRSPRGSLKRVTRSSKIRRRAFATDRRSSAQRSSTSASTTLARTGMKAE